MLYEIADWKGLGHNIFTPFYIISHFKELWQHTGIFLQVFFFFISPPAPKLGANRIGTIENSIFLLLTSFTQRYNQRKIFVRSGDIYSFPQLFAVLSILAATYESFSQTRANFLLKKLGSVQKNYKANDRRNG